MTLPDGITSTELPRRSRFFAALLGVGLLSTLVLAGLLRPDPRGMGTHQQLGLPPCTLVVVAGIPCPACGMTTSWALVTKGRLADALATHVSGTLLALIALVVGIASAIVAVLGRQLSWQPGPRLLAGVAVGMALMVVGEWILRLVG